MSTAKRMVVTGREGQVVRSLLERSAQAESFDVIPLGRPELDLAFADGIAAALRDAQPDVIVSAAAYTAVDQAEGDEETATAVNGHAAGCIGEIAAELNVPVIHLSTDYVFDGSKPSAYLEDDPTAPMGAYGRSKLAGELALSDATANHAILRTAWVYSPYGKNFLKTMLRVAEGRDVVNVVDDQKGNPTSALDIADGILRVAGNLLNSEDPALRGTFHMTSRGVASWADFAARIFAESAARGGASADVVRIPTSAYPTPARRPVNSALNCTKIETVHGVRLPDWQDPVGKTVARVIAGV